jgi:integrase
MSNPIVPSHDDTPSLLAIAGQAANEIAARTLISEYLLVKSPNTVTRHAAALEVFAKYLEAAGIPPKPMSGFAENVKGFANAQGTNPDVEAWRGMTWGLIKGFRKWLTRQGYSIASANGFMSTVRIFAVLVSGSGVIAPEEIEQIKTVRGFTYEEGQNLDKRRETKRRGAKKAEFNTLTQEQVLEIKRQPNTPQGRRDTLMICLLLDHALRVGELAKLTVASLDLKRGRLVFYREKTKKTETHKLTTDTINAAQAYAQNGDMPPVGPLLRASKKNSELGKAGMTTRAITARVRELGKALGFDNLSAHDCRHTWATLKAEKGVDSLKIQQGGGWKSLGMVSRYVKKSEIANEGLE